VRAGISRKKERLMVPNDIEPTSELMTEEY
jgi:hypothetical protein